MSSVVLLHPWFGLDPASVRRGGVFKNHRRWGNPHFIRGAHVHHPCHLDPWEMNQRLNGKVTHIHGFWGCSPGMIQVGVYCVFCAIQKNSRACAQHLMSHACIYQLDPGG